MSISTVAGAIRHARTVITEWEEEGFGFGDWMEVHTRYRVRAPPPGLYFSEPIEEER